jgi:hypothetical protein
MNSNSWLDKYYRNQNLRLNAKRQLQRGPLFRGRDPPQVNPLFNRVAISITQEIPVGSPNLTFSMSVFDVLAHLANRLGVAPDNLHIRFESCMLLNLNAKDISARFLQSPDDRDIVGCIESDVSAFFHPSSCASIIYHWPSEVSNHVFSTSDSLTSLYTIKGSYGDSILHHLTLLYSI